MMMLKITKIQESAGDVMLMLEGKVTEQWASLLDDVCRAYLQQKKTVHLDCACVDFIDASGVAVLKNLPRPQVALVSTPGFVTQLLNIGDQS
jgi:ABC-type transporter Mla MlaB component